MSPELVAMMFFLLSLGAAWVLFKFLRSTAAIKKKQYQLGGAAAGFLMFFYALSTFYNHIAQQQLNAWKVQLNDCRAQLKADEQPLQFEGTISPPPKDGVVVVLSVLKDSPDDSGRFRLRAKGVDVTKDPVAIYVVGQTQHAALQLQENDDLLHLNIPFRSDR